MERSTSGRQADNLFIVVNFYLTNIKIGGLALLEADPFGTYIASPADKDGVINCAEQIQLTNMRASEAPSRRRGASLESIFVCWICEAQLITGLCQLLMPC